MKLSKRERFLIGLLILSVIWVLAFHFLIAPGCGSMLFIAQALEELELEKAEMDLYLEQYPDLEAMLREKESGDHQEDFFYQNIKDVFIDRKLQAIAKNAGVGIRRMSIGAPQPLELNLEAAESFGERPFMERVVTMEVDSPAVTDIMEFADGVYQEDKSFLVSFVDMKRESGMGTASEARAAGMRGIVEVKFYYEEIR